MSKDRVRPRCGFILVELSVVILFVAVLISLLLPAEAAGRQGQLGQRRTVSLDGPWKMSPFTYHDRLPPNTGYSKKYASIAFEDSGWRTANIPEPWWQNHVTGPTLRNNLNEKRFSFVTAWYRKKVMLGRDLSPGRVVIEFDAVDWDSTLYVNGRPVGVHHGRFCSFRFDITEFVKLGEENLLALRVMMDCPQAGRPTVHALQGYRMSRYPQFNIGGIYGSVRLIHVPDMYVAYTRIDPHVSKSIVAAHIETRNTTDNPINATLVAEVIPWDKIGAITEPAVSVNCGTVTLPTGTAEIRIEVPANELRTWEIIRPQLYWLRLKFIANGKPIEDVYERFGYREFVVRGRQFFLNDRPFYIMSGSKTYTDARARGHGSLEFMQRFIRERRENNFNFIRLHGGAWPEWIYDICDEEGLMIMSEWGELWGKAEEKDGRIPPVAEEMVELHRRNYNHPSWGLLIVANESSDIARMTHTYQYWKPRDKQQRPILTASGGQLYVEPIVHNTDVYGAHRYYGRGGYPASFIPRDIELLRINVKKFRGTSNFPFIMNECNVVKGRDLNKAVPDEDYRRYTVDEYLAAVKTHGASDLESQDKMIPISSIGPNSAEQPSWQAAQFVKKLVEMFRINDDLLQGILPWQSYPSQGKQNFQPAFIGADLNWHNKAEFAGSKHRFKVHLRDYDITPYRHVSIRLWVEDLEGKKVLEGKPIHVGDIKTGTRKDFNYSWTIPADTPTGDYLIKLSLSDGSKEISRNLYELYIVGTKDQEPTMPLASVAVLRPRGLNGPSNMNIPDILHGLNVTHTIVPDEVPKLGNYEVLIVPAYYGEHVLERRSLPMHGTNVRLTELPESFRQLTDRERSTWEQVYPGLVKAGPRLRKWIQAGGKILAFEQFCQGPVPWQDELRLVETGYNCFVDPVCQSHPALRDFMIRDFADWEGELGVIIDYTIFPLNQNLIASVATYGHEGHPGGFGMAVSETRIGTGTSMLSQLNAVRRYGLDSVATHYVNRILEYTLAGGIWEGARSTPSVAQGQRPDLAFHPTRYEQSFIGGERWAAQSFRPSTISNLLGIDLEIWRSEDPPGSLIVELRRDANGRPDDSILAKVVRPAGSLPRRRWYPNWENPFKRFDLRFRGLTVGATYWVVVRAEGPDRFPNIYSWIRGRDIDDRPYRNGVALISSDGGKSWHIPNDKHETDFGIKIFGVTDDHLPEWDVPTENTVMVDLKPYCTTGFQDDTASDGKGGWTDQGTNDLRHVPVGNMVWQGVPLHIVDPTENDDRSCVMLKGTGRSDLPEAVKGIIVRSQAKALYFIHTSAWMYLRGVFYVIHYADGTAERVELRDNDNIADWWHPRDLDHAKLAWKGGHPNGGEVGVWMARWPNPHPEKEIDHVDFITVKPDRGIVALLALTAEKP